MGSNIYVAASGAEARLRQLDLVANNLANADTDGFKADRSTFRSSFESALIDREGNPTDGATGGVYVAPGDAGFNESAGVFKRTGAPLDAAIFGKGYFVVETDQGDRYTRAGSFSVNADGQLVTPRGNPILGAGGPIQLASTNARILGNGDVVDGGIVVGTLRVVEFEEQEALSKQGDGLFVANDSANPNDVEQTRLIEGGVEGSNVQPAAEMATLVVLQRAFEAAIQAMQRDDQATESLIQEISQ